MPMPRWDWHTAAAPPASRVSALASPRQEDEPEPVWSAVDEMPRTPGHPRSPGSRHHVLDGAWPMEKIYVYRRWIEAGRPA